MTIVVRKMTQGDLPRALKILAAWNMVPIAPSHDIPQPEVAEIVMANAFSAEIDGLVVGCASYFDLGDGRFETSSFAVDPRFLGHGVGLALQRARLAEMKSKGGRVVITQSDRPETVRWYLDSFPYRVTGIAAKRHAFGAPEIDHWTVLELDLDSYVPQPGSNC